MVIHEMATNASKYGALRTDAGTIRIAWSALNGILTLTWQEKCEGCVVMPTRKGFGSRLIHQSIVVELQGTVDMSHDEGGLHAVFKVPLGDDRI
jgi:two-component sensor histidine kinase